VAVAIKHNFPAAAVTAQEFSPEAFAYLTRNVARHYPDIGVHLSDLREYTHPEPLDLVVSNPPYVPEAELSALQVELSYEPITALSGGEDGLRYFRAIARRYREQLRPGGLLLVEIGAGQSESVAAIFTEWGFGELAFHKDLTGIIRVVEGRRQ
jgi:release factor glutamine methyltransferase